MQEELSLDLLYSTRKDHSFWQDRDDDDDEERNCMHCRTSHRSGAPARLPVLVLDLVIPTCRSTCARYVDLEDLYLLFICTH